MTPPLDPVPHAHAHRAREAKRAEAEAIGIDEAFVSDMVDRFYTAIRRDDLLGPIFAERIADWPPHLARMKQFWRSVLQGSGEFSGNPMARHMAIPGLEPRHFERWLDLFYQTLRAMEQDPRASLTIGERARMIAESLLTGILVRRNGLAGALSRQELPHAL